MENNLPCLIEAQQRENFGTSETRRIRRNGMVPAIIYGPGKENIAISIVEKEITKYYRKPQYLSQLINIKLGDKEYLVLPKAIQLHPLTEIVNHADFILVGNKMQKMEVPIIYENKNDAIGVKRGGYFNIVKRHLTVLAAVDNLQRKFVIDVKDLQITGCIKAEDIKLPDGFKLLTKPKLVIASIIGKKGNASADETDDNTEAESADTEASKS